MSFASPLYAQIDTQKQLTTQVTNACKSSLTQIRQEFSPFLNEYPELQEKKDLILLGPYGEFNALAYYENKKILITKGLCDQLWLSASAIAFVDSRIGSKQQLQKYIKYVTSKAISLESLGSGNFSTEVLTFPLFISFDVNALSSSKVKKINTLTSLIMRDALGFIVGHELGHLALEHNPSEKMTSKESKQHEFDADEFGLNLVEQAKFGFFGSIPSMMIFLARESEIKRSSKSTHPRPECRLQKIMSLSSEVNDMLNNSDMKNEFRKNTGYNPDEFKTLMNESESDCLDNP